MNAWDDLPNAAHIDRVLAHSQANPDKWNAARDAAWNTAWDAAWNTAWNAARAAIRDAARDAARAAIRDAVWDAIRDAARDAARAAAWDACAALIVWDEAGDLMDKPASFVRFLAEEEVHAAVLLLPAVVAMENS